MALLNFNIDKKTDSDGKEIGYINLLIRDRFKTIDGKLKTVKIPTGKKLPANLWDSSEQLAKSSKTFSSRNLNKSILEFRDDVERILDKIESNKEPYTPESIKLKIKESLGQTEKIDNSFFAVFDRFLQWGKIEKSGRTVQKYKTLRFQMLDFQKSKRYLITFDNINIKFYDCLTDYYYNDRKFLNNTFGKYISTLKTFLNWATDRGYNSKLDYRKFKVTKEESDIIYLTAEELKTLYEFDLSDNPKLEKVRDVFCLGCYTGLRFSDLELLKKENFTESSIIVKSFKTKDTVQVPLRREAKAIINKYVEVPGFLPVISNQKFNLYLKDLGKLAKINSKVILVKYRGSERIETMKPKCEYMSTHTGRRTFVTLALEAGLRPEIVMKITGHKSYKTFKKYIKLTDSVIINEFDRAFNKEPGEEKAFMKVS